MGLYRLFFQQLMFLAEGKLVQNWRHFVDGYLVLWVLKDLYPAAAPSTVFRVWWFAPCPTWRARSGCHWQQSGTKSVGPEPKRVKTKGVHFFRGALDAWAARLAGALELSFVLLEGSLGPKDALTGWWQGGNQTNEQYINSCPSPIQQ